ncbi:MAG: alanine--tRNA ligase [Phascolarctobacterium sp.]|uniref:alanine--tRNA ligase n=1 Tax=Phascolarctobacterium sp. TaxID=2049039 RepID=UPI0026DD8B96|nr:alanine--tRNA ligase [Phascolarctobacterium sp.]MDO4921053.1 alanine--tRNA ligase [Phascolarctobacterium sp.]
MKYMTGNEIRERFLKFFQDRGHLMLPSASLIPQDDPTLLIIGAGMAPFKPFFTGKMKPPSPRITTCQKCVRTGDIENVGRTARHHTYFEMLGNFSFGDYFKKEIIPWSWEFLTKELELPADKLWITIHTEDDEAYELWRSVGVPDERIVRLADNWWEIGSGPCGPDSEIHIDLGPERGCGKPTCGPGCDCDRFLELWNLVFTQFNQMPDGTYPPLKSKNIDTGAGLERLASVIQGKPSNFETDLIFPIIEYACKVSGVEYGKDKDIDVSLKVIADHARSMTFMIGDGILPSNEGRGYVLRRILRRAVRHGRLIGINDKFLAGAVDVVIGMFGHVYTNLEEKRDYIQKVIDMEETSFLRTLKQGCELLNEEIAKLKEAGKTELDGATAFRLNDTFGFPWELTEEILEEQGLTMDKASFNAALEVQRQMARDARNDKAGRPVVYNTNGIDVPALKVDESAAAARIVKLYPAHDAQPIASAEDGTEVAVICDVTAFHAEGGGQLGDVGTITALTGVIDVTVTKKLPDGAVIMVGQVTEGVVAEGDEVSFAVDKARKMDIARNHTATHLLHAALKQVLGSHVNQAGSYVGPDRLRFDFSHFSQVTDAELKEVESIVNEQILAGKTVEIEELPIEEAKKKGAMALFGEKYGKIVRVVTVPSFSMEFCGGSHVSNTAQIGVFKIVSEGSSGAGVRRIEAVTGHGAVAHIDSIEDMVKALAADLKCRCCDVPDRLAALQCELKATQKKAEELAAEIAKAQVSSVADQVQTIKGVPVLVQKVQADSVDALRSLGDKMRDKVGGVVVLAAVMGEKVSILTMATKDAIAQGAHSGNIVKAVAKLCGGGGGGRPDMAQAGAKDVAKLDEALAAAAGIVEGMLK